MKYIKFIGIASAIAMSSTMLAGCDLLSSKSEKELPKSLKELGFAIVDITSYGDNANVVHLERDGSEFIGTIDDDFNWLIEPTDKYEELVFHDGLAAVPVVEKREMILAENDEAVKWGFINPKGEWAIKPKYRSVNDFYDGVAIVETIEEDRDDFANSRDIIINLKGEEIGELTKRHLHTSSNEEIENLEKFDGNYTYGEAGFYNKAGKLFKRKADDTTDYTVINKKIFENDNEDNKAIIVKDLSGKQIGTFSVKGEELQIYEPENDEVHSPLMKNLNKNNAVLITGTHNDYLVDASSLEVLLKGKIQTDLADGLLFIEDIDEIEEQNLYDNDEDEVVTRNGTFYDLNGKKVATVTDMVGPFLEDRYFTKENEYYKLVDIDGKTLIDESKKITEVEVESYDDETVNKFKNMVSIKYRENAKDTKLKKGLLNVKKVEFIKSKELLKYRPE